MRTTAKLEEVSYLLVDLINYIYAKDYFGNHVLVNPTHIKVEKDFIVVYTDDSYHTTYKVCTEGKIYKKEDWSQEEWEEVDLSVISSVQEYKRGHWEGRNE